MIDMTDEDRDAFERLIGQQELFDLGKPARPIATGRDYLTLGLLALGLLAMVVGVTAGLMVTPISAWPMLAGVAAFLVCVITAAFIARPRN
jgi:hypothetical protein